MTVVDGSLDVAGGVFDVVAGEAMGAGRDVLDDAGRSLRADETAPAPFAVVEADVAGALAEVDLLDAQLAVVASESGTSTAILTTPRIEMNVRPQAATRQGRRAVGSGCGNRWPTWIVEAAWRNRFAGNVP